MKKILVALFVIFLSVNGVFANDHNYSYSKLSSEISKFKLIIESRLSDKLEGFTEKNFEDLFVLVDGYEKRYLNDSNISEDLKTKNISIIKAFKFIIMEGLNFEENYFSDIEEGLYRAKQAEYNIDIFSLNISSVESRINFLEERNLFKNKTKLLRHQVVQLRESFEENSMNRE